MFQNIKDGVCIPQKHNIIFGLNIVAHVAFLITILSLVFIFYTSRIMSKSVTYQVSQLIDNEKDKLFSLLDDKHLQQIKTLTEKVNEDKLKQMLNANSARLVNNDFVNLTLLEAGALFFVMLIIGFILVKMTCTNVRFTHIIGENILIFILVGVVELLFFLNIILKYIPAYPSEAAHIFIEELNKY